MEMNKKEMLLDFGLVAFIAIFWHLLKIGSTAEYAIFIALYFINLELAKISKIKEDLKK